MSLTRRIALILALTVAALVAATSPALATFPSIKGGKFEVTCKYVKSAQVDPVVQPGVFPSMHLHDFFGNENVTPDSTPASLVGGKTSCVLSKDSAGYWVPAAFRTDTGAQIKPVKAFAYYFGTAGIPTHRIPAGLQLVGGRPGATTPNPDKTRIQFSCGNGGKSHSPVRTAPYNCKQSGIVSQGVVAVVLFPYCWDGTGLDRTDVVYGDSSGNCPMGFGVRLPQVQIHVHYGSSVSSPGWQRGDLMTFANGPSYAFHGDYDQGWVQSKLDALVDGCTAIFKDCGFVKNSRPGPGGA